MFVVFDQKSCLTLIHCQCMKHSILLCTDSKAKDHWMMQWSSVLSAPSMMRNKLLQDMWIWLDRHLFHALLVPCRKLWCNHVMKTDPAITPCSKVASQPKLRRWCKAEQKRHHRYLTPWMEICLIKIAISDDGNKYLLNHLHTLPSPTDNAMHDKRNSMSLPHFSFCLNASSSDVNCSQTNHFFLLLFTSACCTTYRWCCLFFVRIVF